MPAATKNGHRALPAPFPQQYRALLWKLLAKPEHAGVAPRGEDTREILHHVLELDLADKGLFWNTVRSTDLRYLAGELLWYFTGSDKVSEILPYSKFWQQVQNPDGTANSAYGHLLFARPTMDVDVFPLSEYAWVVDRFRRDQDTRQAVMVLNQPRHHWVGNRDVPCTMNIGYLIRDGLLHSWVQMRSSDVWFGLPYDVPFFLLLGRQLQRHLASFGINVGLGTLRLQLASVHLYERNRAQVERMLKRSFNAVDMPDLDADLIHPNGSPTPLLADVAKGAHPSEGSRFMKWVWEMAQSEKTGQVRA